VYLVIHGEIRPGNKKRRFSRHVGVCPAWNVDPQFLCALGCLFRQPALLFPSCLVSAGSVSHACCRTFILTALGCNGRPRAVSCEALKILSLIKRLSLPHERPPQFECILQSRPHGMGDHLVGVLPSDRAGGPPCNQGLGRIRVAVAARTGAQRGCAGLRPLGPLAEWLCANMGRAQTRQCQWWVMLIIHTVLLVGI